MELQALWDGKTHVTFLTEARKSQTLLHNSSRLSSSVCHVAFISPSFGPLKVRCLVWAKDNNFFHNQKETGELPQGYWLVRLLLWSELPWESLIIQSPLAMHRVCRSCQDWNLILKEWKSKERKGSFRFWHICVLLDNCIQKGWFKWAMSGTFNRIPWRLAWYRPEQLAFPVFKC